MRAGIVEPVASAVNANDGVFSSKKEKTAVVLLCMFFKIVVALRFVLVYYESDDSKKFSTTACLHDTLIRNREIGLDRRRLLG